MNIPIHPVVATLVAQLDASQREEFEERAAILEFEAAMLRDHAECLALLEVLNNKRQRSLKKYFCKLYERNGEQEYIHPLLFETDAEPIAELVRRAKEFYPGNVDAQDAGFYFFCGGIYIEPESVVEVTEEEYSVLVRYVQLA